MNSDLVTLVATGVDSFNIVRVSRLTCSRKKFRADVGQLALIVQMWLAEDYPDIRDVIVEVKT